MVHRVLHSVFSCLLMDICYISQLTSFFSREQSWQNSSGVTDVQWASHIFLYFQWEEHQKYRKRQLADGLTGTFTVSDQKLENGNKARVTDGKTVYVENSDRKKSNKLIKNSSVVNKTFGCQKGGSSEPINPPCLRACMV